MIYIVNNVTHSVYNRGDVVYKMGEYNTSNKGYIELLGSVNVI